MIKQIAALATALSLAMPLSLPIAYADETAAQSDTPTVTVVGKRITGDDTYFEISLEVNGDYEDYSSIGVVLKYDPNLIVPAASWDDDAEPADMEESTSWATRRALPTLGKDTWTTHTALTYIDNDENSPAGYLYLGAEYPGTLPNDSVNSEKTDTTDGEATATDTPVAATPTAEPTTAPTQDPTDPYNNPVVVARFMYASDTAKKTIEENWTDDWDKDWSQNTILTIADDSISEASPAQFGFTIYKADFTMKGFQKDFTQTILTESEQATKNDIEIVTCEGKTAKSGGLSLSDIFVIMFYDWDDSLLGTLTSGVGVDATESVNDYVKEAFIHPQLQGNENYDSYARQDNYRGEYPSAGPNSTDPTTPGGDGAVEDGEDYPLTNKLDYCFAGRNLCKLEDDTPMPFAGGWTRVTASTMEDTWTALDSSAETAFGRAAERDENGDLVDPTATDPTMISYDFSDVQDDDVTGGTLSVKAVYVPGEKLNGGTSGKFYTAIGPITYGLVTTGIYSADFEYRRINQQGYGVTKAKKPSIRMDLTQVGASSSTALEVLVENGEIIPVTLTPTNAVSTIGYQLKEAGEVNYINGAERSAANGIDNAVIQLQGAEGVIYKFTASTYLKQAAEHSTPTAGWAASVFTALKLSVDVKGGAISAAAKRKNCTKYVVSLVDAAAEDGVSYEDLTWYQIQYAVINTGAYVDNDTAKGFCEDYDALMAKINS